MDFCFLFHFSSNGNYKETSKFIVDKIKKEDNKSQIKIFAQKVNLFAFIEWLGKVIDESDNLSHFYFKELSIKYRNKDISPIANKEIIKNNIIKCKTAFSEYSNMNFDSIFNFFIDECDYPNNILNQINISEEGLLKCIENYNKK